MRALVNLDPNLLVEKARESLDKAGFAYRFSAGRFIAEFEATSPAHLLIRVEDLTREQMGYPFRARVKVESALEVRRLIGAKDSDESIKRAAATFISTLVDSFPENLPWRGGGILRGREQREIWKSLEV